MGQGTATKLTHLVHAFFSAAINVTLVHLAVIFSPLFPQLCLNIIGYMLFYTSHLCNDLEHFLSAQSSSNT